MPAMAINIISVDVFAQVWHLLVGCPQLLCLSQHLPAQAYLRHPCVSVVHATNNLTQVLGHSQNKKAKIMVHVSPTGHHLGHLHDRRSLQSHTEKEINVRG